jgi:repressor LexA
MYTYATDGRAVQTMKTALTKKQGQVLRFIRNFLEDAGYPPTVREIAGHFRLAGTQGVQKHLAALNRKGYLTRTEKKSRSLRLIEKTAGIPGIPIIGTAAAGMPVLADENIEGALSLDFAKQNKNFFCIRVRGESMIDIHIADGDLVLVKAQPDAHNNDIVVAMVNGEVTVKRFFKEDGTITLKPENHTMQPIVIRDGDFKIIGKVIMVIRQNI